MSVKRSPKKPNASKKSAKLIQSSFRLHPILHKRFWDTLKDRDVNLNSFIQQSVEKFVEKDDYEAAKLRTLCARLYLWLLPAVALIKDLSGRVLFGNHKFIELIGSTGQNIVGKSPRDYVEDGRSAEFISKLDEIVRRERRPIFCIERILINGKIQSRIAIRFPIIVGGDIELTGVIGFDRKQLEDIAKSPDLGGQLISTDEGSPADCLSHSLKHFLHSMPAIGTVKNHEGRLLCINAEYTNVLGKHRSEVENRSTSEIWDRRFSALIIAHDQLVRHTKHSFAFQETVPTCQGLQHRLNFRFPINAPNEIMTGTLGFDHELIMAGLDKFAGKEVSAQAHLFLPKGDPDQLKLVYSSG